MSYEASITFIELAQLPVDSDELLLAIEGRIEELSVHFGDESIEYPNLIEIDPSFTDAVLLRAWEELIRLEKLKQQLLRCEGY